MKIGFRTLLPLIAGLIAALPGSFAQAQTVATQPSPSLTPPVFQSVDANGVDLASGQYVGSLAQLSVGAAGSGLSWSYNINGTLTARDNLVGTVHGSADAYNAIGSAGPWTVSLGGASETFTNVSNGVYTSNQGSGATLQLVMNGSVISAFIYTLRDGTVAYFNCSQYGYVPNQGVGVSTLTKPSGEVLTWAYNAYPIKVQSGSVLIPETLLRTQSVSSNKGWQIHYQYQNDSSPAAYSPFTSISSVRAINTAVDYCDPYATSCTSLSQAWPAVSASTNASGTSISITDALNRTASASISSGALTITLPSGLVKTVYFNNSSTVHSVVIGPNTWSYTYTSFPSTVVKDPQGNSNTVFFDPSTLRPNETKDGLGHGVAWTYDTYGRVTKVVHPDLNYTTYAYDARGNVTTVTNVASSGAGLANIVVSASYDATCAAPAKCNQPNAIIDGRGKETDYTYDPNFGGVLTVTQPATVSGVRPQVRYSYAQVPSYVKNSGGGLTQVASVWALTGTSTCRTLASCAGTSDELKTATNYQNTNLLAYSTTTSAGDGSLSATSSVSYYNWGDVFSSTDALGNVTRYRYDLTHQLNGVVGPDPDGAGPLLNRAVRYTYSADGLTTLVERGTVVSQSDSDWNNFNSLQQSIAVYDSLDRQTVSEVTAGGTAFSLTQTSYDSANRVTCVAQRLNPAAFSSLPASACSQGAAGNDGPDRIVAYTYDSDNRVIQATSGYGTAVPITETTTYGGANQTLSVTDGKGNLTAYSYDGFDRLSQTNYPSKTVGAGAANSADYQALSYDSGGNVVSIRRRDGQTVSIAYDNLSRPVNDLSGAYYVYDNLGHVTSVSNNGQTLTAAYDAFGRQLNQGGPLGTVSYLYDSLNRRTRMTWPDGFYVNYGYDAASELTGITDSAGATVASYAYDNLGDRAGLARGNGLTTSYGYDNASRLTSLTHGSVQSYGFAYAASGQIKSQTTSNDSFAYPMSAANRLYGVNGLNQITTSGPLSVAYDGRGNVSSDGVNSYGYDVANRLTTMSNGAALSYDPLSRLSKTAGSATTQFLYDGTSLIAEYDGNGNLLRRYIHGPGSDEPIAWYEGSGTANRQWLLANAQGSVIAVTNASGGVTATNTYDEYGLPGSGNTGRFQYTGQKWIPEIGMYDYKARIYSPSFGRFLQTDPIGYGDGMNWYAYVHGDPINGRDPSGNQCVWDDGSFDSLDGEDSVTNEGDCGNAGGRWVDPGLFSKAGISSEAWTAAGSGLSWWNGSTLDISRSLLDNPEDGYSTYADYQAANAACPGGPYATYSLGVSGTAALLGGVNGGLSINISHSLTNLGGLQISYTTQAAAMYGYGMYVGGGLQHSVSISNGPQTNSNSNFYYAEGDVGYGPSYGVSGQVDSQLQSISGGVAGREGGGLGMYAGAGYGSSHTGVLFGCGTGR